MRISSAALGAMLVASVDAQAYRPFVRGTSISGSLHPYDAQREVRLLREQPLADVKLT